MKTSQSKRTNSFSYGRRASSQRKAHRHGFSNGFLPVFLAVVLVVGLAPSLGAAKAALADSATSFPLFDQPISDAALASGSSVAEDATSQADPGEAATEDLVSTQDEVSDSAGETAATSDVASADESADASSSDPTAAKEAASEPAKAPAKAPADAPAVDTAEVWVDGTNGSDANEGTSADKAFATLGKALQASGVKTIHISGTFASVPAATIPAGVTLDVAGDTSMMGAGGNGITLASGATLQSSAGATLTMSGFATALVVGNGATLGDGHYVFSNNAGANGTHGLQINGTVKGSSRSALTITANDKCETNFYTGSATFENCTVAVNSGTRTWLDQCDLHLTNASFTVSGFGQGYYVNTISMVDSEFTVNQGASYRTATGMFIGGGSVQNSTITANTGSTAGISIAAPNGLTFTNSTVNLNNGGIGGFNVNSGNVYFKNSTLTGNGSNSSALLGAQSNGYLEFSENSRIESPAASNADNGGGQTKGGYVILGGSYQVAYSSAYNHDTTTPTNGAANGNEWLEYFTLNDASVTQLSPLSANGTTYDYPVVTASADGQKHVFVPGVKVTFQLNNGNAKFADGTTAAKSTYAMRGYTLADAACADRADGITADVSNLGDPVDINGVKFLG